MKYIEKIIIIFIASFVVFVSSQFSTITSLKYYTHFHNENDETGTINIPGYLTQEQKEDLLSQLDHMSQDYHVIVYYTLYEDFQRNVYVAYDENQQFFKDIEFQKEYCVGTKYSQEDTVYIYHHLNELNVENLYGEIYIQSENSEFFDQHAYDLLMIDGALSLSKLEHNTLDEQQQAIYKDWVVLSFVGLVILVLLYCVVIVFDLIKKQRKISLYKLNGLSSQDIFKILFLKKIREFLVVFFVVGVLGYVWIVDNGVLFREYVYWWILTFVLEIVLMSIVYMICYQLMRHMCILEGIQNKYSHQIVFIVHYILKSLFVVLTAIFLMMSIQSIKDLFDEYQMSQTLLENVETKVKIESFSSEVGGTLDEMLALSHDVQEAIQNDSQTIYIDAIYYDKRYKDMLVDDPYDIMSYLKNAIRVNQTYLQVQDIQDIHGQSVSRMIEDHQCYVLVPSSMMNNREIKTITSNSSFENYHIIEIADNQKCYTYQPGYIENQAGFIDHNYIVVDQQLNIYSCLIDVGQKDLQAGFKEWCKNAGIDDQYIHITNVKNDLRLYMSQLISQTIIHVVEFVMALVGIFLLIYQYLACYIEKMRRKIFIYSLHGESLIYKYQDYFKSQIILYAGVMIVLFMMGYQGALIWNGVVFGIDFVFAYMMMFMMDKHILILERRGYYDYS